MAPYQAPTTTAVTSMAYPRTGKRGVPQQFPRRLYEMLQSEAKLAESDSTHVDIITWSASGKAFRILNVSKFSTEILPKYFRTSKFSSFQRNLNLYGFCKVRRGPDTDMYAHPSFLRGHSECLSQLRKCNSTAARKRLATQESAPTGTSNEFFSMQGDAFNRAPPTSSSGNGQVVYHRIMPLPGDGMKSLTLPEHVWPQQSPPVVSPTHLPISPSPQGVGKLDLLALAMTSMEERDSKIGQSVVQTAQ